ncbi:sodium-dependent transporter [Gynuella sunshinyii]|uniref:Na+-dependent transporter of the SNF family n=1 Tax=Gynuella sunshinyii YC6258 TaxID=1445510 RepID=A0A0C5VTD2_9GAMM|nr:sodium-dependent transporter [Gynuella sunshinyii]AJQ97446.1 Na+-dependent transporter of the SNF family [Gynuella sunshinyii YC6258]
MVFGHYQYERFSYRWIMLLAISGAAIGFSNLLNFPILVGSEGGGAFLVLYLGCKFLVAIPVVMAEMALARRSRQSPVYGMETVVLESHGHRIWALVGHFSVLAGILTAAVYLVVSSWAAAYFWHWLHLPDVREPDHFLRYFFQLMSDADGLIHIQAIIIAFLIIVTALGLKAGYQPMVVVMVPALLLAVVFMGGSVVNSADLGFAAEKIFTWRTSDVSWQSVLLAIRQSFYTLGIGVGAIWACGSFMDKGQSIGWAGITVALSDLIVSIAVAFFVWGHIGQALEEGNEVVLLFQWLPSHLSYFWGLIFWGFMLLSGITSALFLLEPGTRMMVERFHLNRAFAASIVGGLVLLLAWLGQLSFGRLAGWFWYGMTIYESLVFISSTLLVPLVGFMMALFVGWVMLPGELVEEIRPSHPVRYALWRLALRFVSIVAILLLFFASLEQYLLLKPDMILLLSVCMGILFVGIRKIYLEFRR